MPLAFPASAWIFWGAAGALGTGSAVLLVWALFGDRPRGRRRCPRCWYDMSSVPGLACPECGHNAKRENRLFRTRRRRRWATLALATILVGAALGVTPTIQRDGWARHAPTWLLIADLAAGRQHSTDEVETLTRLRIRNGDISGWEKRHLARVMARRFRTPFAAPQHRITALQFLIACGRDAVDGLNIAPDLLVATNDTDGVVRIVAWTALATLGVTDPHAIEAISVALENPAADDVIRQRLVIKLHDAGPDAGAFVPALIHVLERPELQARNRGFIVGGASLTLGNIGPRARDALPALESVAADAFRAPAVRYAVNLAIARIRDESLSESAYHVRMLKDPDAEVRGLAVDSLNNSDMILKDPQGITGLLHAMADTDTTVSQKAIVALRSMLAQDEKIATLLKKVRDASADPISLRAEKILAMGGDAEAFYGLAPLPAPSPPPDPPPMK